MDKFVDGSRKILLKWVKNQFRLIMKALEDLDNQLVIDWLKYKTILFSTLKKREPNDKGLL